MAALTENPSPGAEAERLIADRIAEYREKGGNAEQGKNLRHNRAACHKFDGIGVDIGPQLEGIGNRGIERMVEDIIDPNRNIDASDYTIAVLKDGRVVTGLKRREVGQLVVFATIEGKEITIQNEIERQAKSSASIMPTGFGLAIPSLLTFVTYSNTCWKGEELIHPESHTKIGRLELTMILEFR